MLKPLDTSNWTRADALREAKLQTDAVQRLNVWLRLGYSVVAIGFLLGYGGFFGGYGTVIGVVGIVVLLLGAAAALVLKVGITNAKKNIERILATVDAASGSDALI